MEFSPHKDLAVVLMVSVELTAVLVIVVILLMEFLVEEIVISQYLV